MNNGTLSAGITILDILESGVRDIQMTRYAAVASSAIVFFDHVITFGDEVDLIWNSSWSLGKALFIFNRYYTLASACFNNYGYFSPHLNDNLCVSIPRVFTLVDLGALPFLSCLTFFKWQGWTGLVSCIIAEIILQMRLYALYFLDKKVLAVMVFLFVASISTSGVIMGLILQKVTAARAHPGPGITFCTPIGVSPEFWVFWVPMLAFETVLCAMALFRGFQTFKKDGSLFQSGRYLVGILIRDSIFYYLVMFVAYFTDLIMWLVARQTLVEVPIGFSVALACVLSNRIILNVRQVNKDLDLIKTRKRRRRRRHGETSTKSSPGTGGGGGGSAPPGVGVGVRPNTNGAAHVFSGMTNSGSAASTHPINTTSPSTRHHPHHRPPPLNLRSRSGDVEDPIDPRSEDYQTKFGVDSDSEFDLDGDDQDDHEDGDDGEDVDDEDGGAHVREKESPDSTDRFVDGIVNSYVDADLEASAAYHRGAAGAPAAAHPHAPGVGAGIGAGSPRSPHSGVSVGTGTGTGSDADLPKSPRSPAAWSFVDVGAIPIPSSEMLDQMEAEIRNGRGRRQRDRRANEGHRHGRHREGHAGGSRDYLRSTKVEVSHASTTAEVGGGGGVNVTPPPPRQRQKQGNGNGYGRWFWI